MTEIERIKNCLKQVRAVTDFIPETAVILGSGLGALAESINKVCTVAYSDIQGMPVSTVSGHNGCFVFGYIGSVPVVIMQGRVHYYEGYDMKDVVLPTRLMGAMGAKKLFLTNAAGGIGFKAGELMLIKDHISSFVPSPLIGKNIDDLGTRFPDMSEVYSARLRKIILDTAAECGIPLREGVYLQTSGPNFETPAEIKAYTALGADAVGMSTAVEAMAARHMGLSVCGISCITNSAAGISKQPLTHEEVKKTADTVAERFRELITKSVINIG